MRTTTNVSVSLSVEVLSEFAKRNTGGSFSQAVERALRQSMGMPDHAPAKPGRKGKAHTPRTVHNLNATTSWLVSRLGPLTMDEVCERRNWQFYPGKVEGHGQIILSEPLSGAKLLEILRDEVSARLAPDPA